MEFPNIEGTVHDQPTLLVKTVISITKFPTVLLLWLLRNYTQGIRRHTHAWTLIGSFNTSAIEVVNAFSVPIQKQGHSQLDSLILPDMNAGN